MDASAATPSVAWQPLTFRGVAAFAQAPLGRLAAVQFVVAVLSASATIIFFHYSWNPSISAAIEQLNSQGEIKEGELNWTGTSPERLGRGSFVSFVVDPDNTGDLGEAADVDWIFTRREIRLHSMFGYAEFPYPEAKSIPFNRPELKPWWGAWRPAIYAMIGVSCVGGLFAAWSALAVFYSFPIRLIAFYGDREITWPGAWRLAGAAVLPGALFMDIAIIAYTFSRLNLLQLLAAAGVHFVVGWIYVIVGPTRLPTLRAGSGSAALKNPFAASPSGHDRDPK